MFIGMAASSEAEIQGLNEHTWDSRQRIMQESMHNHIHHVLS